MSEASYDWNMVHAILYKLLSVVRRYLKRIRGTLTVRNRTEFGDDSRILSLVSNDHGVYKYVRDVAPIVVIGKTIIIIIITVHAVYMFQWVSVDAHKHYCDSTAAAVVCMCCMLYVYPLPVEVVASDTCNSIAIAKHPESTAYGVGGGMPCPPHELPNEPNFSERPNSII